MNPEEADAKVLEILLKNDNPQRNFYRTTPEQYKYSNHTPISPIGMPYVNNKHNVVFTEEAYYDLLRIRQITEQTNGEVAFFIFGEEKENGTIWLDSIIFEFKSSSNLQTDFGGINSALNEYVSEIQNNPTNKKQIIVHAYTHSQSNANDNFSFDDLSAYIQITNLHHLFQNRQIETIGMPLAPDGDFNFIKYENNPKFEGLYTFPTVYFREDNGNAQELPAYQNGNYLTNKTLQK